MEKELGNAYPLIKSKINLITNNVYQKDMNRLKNFKYLESKQTIYLIFRAVAGNDAPTTLYVGKTSQTIEKRFKNHLNQIKAMGLGKKDWNSKYLWMGQIIDSNGKLTIVELNKVQTSDVYMYEQEWITYLRSNGFKMLNKNNSKYYKTRFK